MYFLKIQNATFYRIHYFEKYRHKCTDKQRCCYTYNIHFKSGSKNRYHQTWTPPPALFGAEKLDSGEDTESTGFLACSFGFIRTAHAAAGVWFLTLPGLPLLPNKGAGDRRSHGQFDGATDKTFRGHNPFPHLLRDKISLGKSSLNSSHSNLHTKVTAIVR